MFKGIYLGGDPEFLVVDTKRRPTPAHLANINAPIKLESGSVIRDGWMVELNPRPSHCRALFSNIVRDCLYAAKDQLPRGYSLIATPAFKVDLKVLKRKDTPPDLLTWGCRPALNAYTGVQSAPKVSADSHPYRYGGGHMWISTVVGAGAVLKYLRSLEFAKKTQKWYENPEMVALFIKMCDRYIALPLTYLFGSSALAKRRENYGRAGEFRMQSLPSNSGCDFALEYRTPGPEFYLNNATLGLAFGVYRHLYEHFTTFAKVYKLSDQETVREVIDAGVSDPAMLKLVKRIPDFYSADVLQAMKPWCDRRSRNVSEALRSWPHNPHRSGWSEAVGANTEFRVKHFE